MKQVRKDRPAQTFHGRRPTENPAYIPLTRKPSKQSVTKSPSAADLSGSYWQRVG